VVLGEQRRRSLLLSLAATAKAVMEHNMTESDRLLFLAELWRGRPFVRFSAQRA